MRALINFKICDNAKECGGVAVCPTNAMYFDEDLNTIVIDDDNCISCGICEKECPIGAILVAGDDEQYSQYVQDIENDPRTTKDLFVDRYGAASLSEFFLIESKDLDDKIKSESLTLIEFFDSEIAECLLKSIPIKEITDEIKEKVYYYKIDKDEKIALKYKIEEFPSLLIFRNNKLLGSISGYYNSEDKEEFKEKINNIIDN